MSDLLEPEEFVVTLKNGKTKTFILSSFPATVGREITTQYPITAMPKVSSYQSNEEIMLKALSYVAVVTDAGTMQRLTTRALIDNHCVDWETLVKVEWAQMNKNCSFFANGKASSFFEGFAEKMTALITKTLTDFSQQSSGKDLPPSTN